MTSINEQTMNFNKSIKVNFDGGDLTTDSGILLYKEFNDTIGLSQAINKTVHIKDQKSHHTHQNNEMIKSTTNLLTLSEPSSTRSYLKKSHVSIKPNPTPLF